MNVISKMIELLISGSKPDSEKIKDKRTSKNEAITRLKWVVAKDRMEV